MDHDTQGGHSKAKVVTRKKTSLYRDFQDERKAILHHKWLESEKAGKDIGVEAAILDWVRNHRAQWQASRSRRQTKRGPDQA